MKLSRGHSTNDPGWFQETGVMVVGKVSRFRHDRQKVPVKRPFPWLFQVDSNNIHGSAPCASENITDK